MMKGKLVSIVVPCYNVEKYVIKCINSIVNQTYENIEIIIVNDGSTDSTNELLDKIKKDDSRINVYNKKNGGLSDARNFGLEKSKGEYICFVDSDDYIDKHYVEKLVNSIIETNADISCCDFWYIDENNNKWSIKDKKVKIYNSEEAMVDFFSCRQELEVMTWNKLYKKNIFTNNGLLFPMKKLHEDNFTTYKLFYYSKKVSLVPDKLYFYLQRNNSIMGSAFNERRLDKLDAVNESKQFIIDHKLQLNEEFTCYEFSVYFDILNNMIKSKYDRNKMSVIKSRVLENISKYKNNKYISKSQKTCLNLIRLNFNLYIFIYNLKNRLGRIK